MGKIYQIINIFGQFEAPNRRTLKSQRRYWPLTRFFFPQNVRKLTSLLCPSPSKILAINQVTPYARIKLLNVDIAKCYVLKFAPVWFLPCMAAAIPFAIKTVLLKIDTVVSLTEKAYQWHIHLQYYSRLACVGPIIAPTTHVKL